MSIVNAEPLSARSLPPPPKSVDVSRPTADNAVDIGDLYRAAVTRARLLPICLAVTLASAFVYIVVTPARYTAAMSIMVDTRERPPIGVDTPVIPQNTDTALVESQMRLLTSNTVLRRVVESERLQTDSEFSAAASTSLLGVLKAALIGDRAADAMAMDNIVDRLSKAIVAKRSEKSYVIDVEVRASNRKTAERIATALAKAYFDMQSKLSDDVVNRQNEWVNKKIADIRGRVEDAERRVTDFRKAHSLFTTDGHLLPEQQLKDANTALIDARSERSQQEAKFEQLRGALRVGGSIDTVNEAIKSPMIEKLRTEYAASSRDEAYALSTLGALHPSYKTVKAHLATLRAQMGAEMQRIAAAQQHDLLASRKAEKAAERVVADLQASIGDLSTDKIELDELERRAEALRDRYEKALAARENLRPDISSPNSTLIDEPHADAAQTTPKPLPAIIIALAAGVNLWIFCAIFAEYRSRRAVDRLSRAPPPRAAPAAAAGRATIAPNPRAAESRTTDTKSKDASPLAELPDLLVEDDRPSIGGRTDKNDIAGIVSRVMNKPGSIYRAAMGTVYDAVLGRLVDTGNAAPVVAVAAGEAGAGASTIALSLAHVGLNRGKRVLLIERYATTAISILRQKELVATVTPENGRRSLSVYQRDDKGGGVIYLTSWDGRRTNWPIRARGIDEFDLVVVDCGALNGDSRLVAPGEEINGLLLVDGQAPSGQAEKLLRQSNLAKRFVGSVRTPVYRERPRTTGT